MKQDIIQIGHPALKKLNKTVTSIDSVKTKKLIRDLKHTLEKNALIGIAASQIGENYEIFVTDVRNTPYRNVEKEDQFRVYINPKIIYVSFDTSVLFEGCGSVLSGKLFGPVARPKEIVVQALDEKGRIFEMRANGILGRVIQHEYDHVHGIEFLEKVSDYKKLMASMYYVQRIKNSQEQLRESKITIIEHNYL